MAHPPSGVTRRWLEAEKGAAEREIWVSNETTCYGDFVDRYVSKVARHPLWPKTFENYPYEIKNHIRPALGAMRIISIRPDHATASHGLTCFRTFPVHRQIHPVHYEKDFRYGP